ncbi:MAG: GGDEF domain-containing protein [Gammaproteobacteria bacterium]|nr:GGDEF domain-containing protein [Gammaproteobacteria bacterium]
MDTHRFYSEIFKTVLDNSLDLFAYIDLDQKYQYVSESYAEFYDFKVSDLIGNTPEQVFDKSSYEDVIKPQVLNCLNKKAAIHYESWITAQNSQQPRYLYVSYLPHIDSNTNEIVGIIVISKDITEFKRAEGLLAKTANTDALTNIHNRLYLEKKLEQLTKQNSRESDRFALLFCDLDGFKHVNDKFGHAIGDKILYQAARRLSKNTRKEDTLARYGGDEFIILVSPLSNDEVIKTIKEKVERSFSQPFEVAGNSFKVGISIGVSIYPDEATNTADMIHKADQRMYFNKNKKVSH